MTVFKLVKPKNIPSLMDVRPSPKETYSRTVQPVNGFGPMEVIGPLMTTVFKCVL